MIEFFVEGEAKPAGSKNGFALKKGGRYTGRVGMADASGPKGKAWRATVAAAARQAYRGEPIAGRPVSLTVVFYRKRPKSHFGTGRNAGVLKPTAPEWPLPKPDTLKLTRSVEDALTGIVYADDALVVAQRARKVYCSDDAPREGVMIFVCEL